jgi:predicted nucleic acid-binding protein
MSVFIDTGVFIAYINKKDEHHAYASKLVDKIMKNEFGAAFTSDMIFDEAMTFILYKTGDINKAIGVRDLIFGNNEKEIVQFINLLFIDREVFEKTLTTFIKYAGKKLSFTDCSSIELMKNKDIENIVSFDAGFDGIIPRFH